MSQIVDEIRNLVQHVEDVLGKIGHTLTDDGRRELEKMHDQGKTVLSQVDADVKEDVADVEGDVQDVENQARTDDSTGAAPTLSPSNPPAPRPTIAAGVPAVDVTGSQATGGASQS